MSNIFQKNLRRLRLAKDYTQEQAAEYLGVSPQAVSRWECGSTMPDVMSLPEIAKLYCVTVDDLFKEDSMAYKNYASHLLSVYEATGHPEDFIRADVEYKKLFKSGSYTTDDLRSYGILHQYMMNDCRKKALESFDQVIAMGSQEDEETYYSTINQKMYLLSQIGKSSKNIAEQSAALEKDMENPRQWILLIAAYYHAGKNEEAYLWFKKALEKFSDIPSSLYVYGGDICRQLKNYDEALIHWDKAIELDDQHFDAQYSKGFCYQELGEWEKAYDVWRHLINRLEAKGYHIEAAFPRQLAKECKEKIQ